MTHKSYTLSIYTLLPLHTLLAIFLRSINILEREIPLFRSKPVRSGVEPITICKVEMDAMEVYGKSMVAVPTNVIYLSSILGQDGSNNPNPNLVHKCDWKCENEHVCGNMFRCKLTGLTHICDKNCNQRIVYDNNNSLCRVSRQIFPLTAAEVQAVKGVRRKLEEESSESCAFKRRRSGQFCPSPFERSFSAVAPICSQVGDGMDIN
ncbi:hypothetical protein Hdeb2414_s0133g00807541 [Helianthus debilis subsp. tardiflorus]